MSKPYDLQRFVEAQEPVYPAVVSELGAGRKQSHWIWFIFPQISGLWHSAMAQKYAIGSRGEAEAFLAYPILGSRLRECTRLVIGVQGRSAHAIFGSPDDMKFRSSMTLFAKTTSDNADFVAAIAQYFDGAFDEETIARL